MTSRNNYTPFIIIAILFCELVGLLSTPFTISAIPTWYAKLQKPFFSPPNWVFGPAWTLLYALMGISFARIWINGWFTKKTRVAMQYFFIQLLLNFLWSFLFFFLQSPILGLIDIILMLLFIILTMQEFKKIDRISFYLFIPYLAWVSFATLLNIAIAMLN